MYYLYMEKNFKKNVKWMVFVFFLFVSATINVSMNMTFNEWAWIDFRGFPGGPFAFLQEEQSNVINTVGNSFGICTGFLTDALLVCWEFDGFQLIPLIIFIITDLPSSCCLSDVVCYRDPYFNMDSHDE